MFSSLLKHSFSPEVFREQGIALVNQLADFLSRTQQAEGGHFFHQANADELYKTWQAELESDNKDLNALFAKVIAGSMNVHHPRYMGHQVAVPLPAAALSSLVAGFLNNGMAVYEMGNISSAMERIVIGVLAKALGMPAAAGGLLTSGGTLANLTALLTARAVIGGAGVWTEGQTENYAVMVSEQAHYCIDRAVRVMGWGSRGTILIPTHAQYGMRTELLSEYYAKAKAEGLRVIAVVGSACSTATGAYDNLEAIGAFCRENGLWFHVDGAHGAGVAFSQKHRHLIAGVEQADSVIADFHKMMLTPALVTAVVYKEGRNAHCTFQQQAQYLWAQAEETEWYNYGKKTFECTKLMMSLKVYSILHQYGTAIFEEYNDNAIALAQSFAKAVRERKAFETAHKPQSNIVCFRYVGGIANDEAANRLNAAIRQELLKRENFYIVQTTLQNRLYLRVTLMNPFTTEADMAALLNEIETIGQELA